MLTNEAIEVEAKPRGLTASEFTIRHVLSEHDEDTGWRFQAVIRNGSSASLADLEYSLRYYDSFGKFVGLDEGFALGSDDMDRQGDKSISIELSIPGSATKGVFSIKAKKANFLEKHNLLIFGGAMVVAAVLFFLADFFK